MIGLCGAHRTGKSTLGKKLAEHFGIPFLKTEASNIFKELGVSPKDKLTIFERYFVQEAMFNYFDQQYAEAPNINGVFIADRTPIDLASYLLAEVTPDRFSGDDEVLIEMINQYVERCFRMNQRYFSVTVHVQPGIPVENCPTSAVGNRAYMEMLNTIQLGLTSDERFGHGEVLVVPRELVDFNKRVSETAASIAATIRDFAKLRSLVSDFH